MKPVLKTLFENLPAYKQIVEEDRDQLQEITANGNVEPQLRNLRNVDGAHSSPGEDLSRSPEVAGFLLDPKEWSEEIPEELLKLPHISETVPFTIPESVCGSDDRAIIGNTTIGPWKFICKLYIDNTWVASGFFIGPRCIITNGHVVFPNNAWARNITVVPGQNGGQAPFGSQVARRFYSVLGWTRDRNADYDYGAVILPDDQLYRRVQGYLGYQILNSSQLLHNSGYPGDKPNGTQWYNAGPIHTLGARRFFYMIDTAGGQSGSPVFIGSGPNSSSVGVHGYGGCPNSAVRLIPDVATNWNAWRQL